MKKKTVKEWRIEKGVSRMKVAEALGIHYNSICNKEAGKFDWTWKEVAKVADLFGISVNDIRP